MARFVCICCDSRHLTRIFFLLNFRCVFNCRGGSAWQIADKLENTKITISLKVLLQLILKYAYTIDILIHQFDHIEFFYGTLSVFQNF